MEFMEKVKKCGIVPVVVIENVEDAVPTAKALLGGGICFMEITFRTACAADAISQVAKEVPDMIVGAGTILNQEQAEKIEAEFSDKGGYALEADAKGVLTGLGFDASQFDKSPLILSGGWRMRLELAKLLINEPNFLILDEPTNHLDLPSLTWLEGYLKSFRGTLLFVSHDREFLNNLSDQIIHISNGNVKVYNGDFDAFVEQREANAEFAKKQKEALKKKQDHLKEFVDRFRYKASKAKQAQSKLKIIERLKQLEEQESLYTTKGVL